MTNGEKKDMIVSLLLPASMKEQLEQYAQKHDRSVSWVIRKAIEFYLASPNPEADSQKQS